MKKSQKRKRKPWFRLLIGRLYFHRNLPVSYCFRQWLFEMVRPENLTVYQHCYVPGEEFYAVMDPDMERSFWGEVKIAEDVFQPLSDEALKAIISPKTCSDTPHQSV